MSSYPVSPEGSVTASPTLINAARNTTVEFICNALGGPTNIFTWTRLNDGTVLSNDSLLEIVVDSAQVGSDYECLVGNKAGNETTQVTLYGKPYRIGSNTLSVKDNYSFHFSFIYLLCAIFTVAPMILVFPVAVNVTRIQDNISLTCNASGFLVPQIMWTHNMTGVNDSNDRVSIVEDPGQRSLLSTLTITRAMTNDSGQYECIVTSPVATYDQVLSGPVTILVQGTLVFYLACLYITQLVHLFCINIDRPERPQNVRGTVINSRNLTLEWVEPHDNNAPIQGYRVTYSDPPFIPGGGVEVEEVVEIEMVVITGLHPGVTYNFTVVAFNEIGVSNSSVITMVTTEEEGVHGKKCLALPHVMISCLLSNHFCVLFLVK